ncbi:MAG: phosphoribosyltransferase [Nitrososphaeraceae archaeon]
MALFKDRVEAAEQLARRVQEWLDNNDRNIELTRQKSKLEGQESQNDNDEFIVLAIPRGGVVIGDIVSNMLHAKLDIVVSRKIGAPDNPELAIGAVMPDGSYFLNEDIVNMLNVPKYYITEQANIQKKEIERRLQSFRGEISKGEEEEENSGYYDDYNNFEGKTVILVDDGIATGATIISAANWLKTKQNCCKTLIIAVPVAPPPSQLSLQSSNEDIVSKLNQIADKVIILYRPEQFYAVGQFYEHFEQVSDTEVREIMIRHGYRPL